MSLRFWANIPAVRQVCDSFWATNFRPPLTIFAVIMKFAGGDATSAYDEIHAPGIVEETLDKEQLIGIMDSTAVLIEETPAPALLPLTLDDERPPLESVIAVHDFEDIAKAVYTKKAFAFYSSAATDLISHQANLDSYGKLMLRPRVLRNVKEVSTRRSILGCDSSAPFFVSPAAMARLAHPDGEMAVARGCAAQNICYVVR